jgi:L-arabinose isomerase
MTAGAAGGPAPIRPRLGVLYVTSGWFRDVGLQTAEGDTSSAVERTAAAVTERLHAFCDTVASGVLFSAAEAEKAARQIRDAGVDGLLLVPLMWCEDAVPRAALKLLRDLPLVLWVFSPAPSLPGFVPFQSMLQGSGPVAALQLSGMLKREGVKYRAVAGHKDDAAVYEEIRCLASGMAVKRALAGMKIGVLPFPCDQMSTTYVDEFGLRARYGIELRYLEIERVRRAAAGVADGEIRAFREGLAGGGTRVSVDEANLAEGIRYALAMERVMAGEGLSALAMNDVIPEMHSAFGLRPCLWNPALTRAGAVVAMETDVAAAAAMRILALATGFSPFYTETFSADYAANAVLMGHAGYHDASNADPAAGASIVPDVEYENSDRFTGCVSLFKYRPGPVTSVNSVWSGRGLKWVVLEGESLPGPLKMDGNSHVLFRPDAPVKSFFRRAAEDGVSQHWIFVPGRRAAELALVCQTLDIEAAIIRE